MIDTTIGICIALRRRRDLNLAFLWWRNGRRAVEISIAHIAYVSHRALTLMKDDSELFDTTGSFASLARALEISVLALQASLLPAARYSI